LNQEATEQASITEKLPKKPERWRMEEKDTRSQEE
jgi:hypothetical protein